MAVMAKASLALLFLANAFGTASAAEKLTPAAMISAPRRGTALPSPDGSLALYTMSTYSFETHKRYPELRVMDLKTGSSWLFTNSSAAFSPNWLGDGHKFIWAVGEDDGSTSFAVGDATKPDAEPVAAGSVPGSVSDVKITSLCNGTIGIVFSGQANPNGTLFNPSLAETPRSSGRAYTKLFVRHWDTYITPQRNSLFYALLSPESTGNATAKYTLSEPVNALAGSDFESPISPFGSTDNFDVGPNGLVFIAKDPLLNAATTTKSDVYYIPLSTFQESPAPKFKIIETPGGIEGASVSPLFSKSGKQLAFIRQKGISYESDKNRIFIVKDITASTTAAEFYKTTDGIGAWDRSPGSLIFSNDDKSLYVNAEDIARFRVWSFPSDPDKATSLPQLIYNGSAIDMHTLASDSDSNEILVTSYSIIDNSKFSIVNPLVAASSNATAGVKLVSSNLDNGAKYGLNPSQISEIWSKGDGDHLVHSWVIKPSNFDPAKKYPLAFIIHGGPQGAWDDGWSTRWNLATYAEQGYVVVAPNPTGSTGFGQNLTDAIQNNWGGAPFNDLVKVFDHVESNLKFVDTSRSVALGASYGGYMIYWILGHDFQHKFKALVDHDGSFNTLSQYSSEELWFMNHDFNGTLWDSYDNYARWNPANHTDKWATPTLVIHNEKDYRLPISEGIAAFNVLQSRGVPSKFLTFPNENHWVLKQENSLVWHKTVFDWINEHVGLPAYSSPDDAEFRATLQNGPWI